MGTPKVVRVIESAQIRLTSLWVFVCRMEGLAVGMLWKAVISCSLRTPFLLHQKAESNFPPLESRRTCGSLVTERMEQKA